MTGSWIALAVCLLFAALAGLVAPSVGVRMLWPALAAGAPRVRNYRGVEVVAGLGVVWLLWAASVAVVEFAGSLASQGILGGSDAAMADAGFLYARVVGGVPWPLVIGALAFGMVDDVFGHGGERGFRGHLSALRSGRLTTGGLKMLGIGALSAVFAADIAMRAAGYTQAGAVIWLPVLATWVSATLVIALAANLINLLDLRPARALKGYVVLTSGACALVGWRAWQSLAHEPLGEVLPHYVLVSAVVLALGVLLWGPVLAVWRLDAGERGMLGDAGANAMGALAGYGIASGLPLPALMVAAAVLIALNLVSERIPFSRIIERSAVLGWIDRLGRSSGAAMAAGDDGVPSAGYDDTCTGNRKDGVS